jgi:hypothetical protein
MLVGLRYSAAVNLSDFTLKSTAYDKVLGGAIVTSTFVLPSLSIPANGFAVVASKSYALLTDGPKMVYVANGNLVPSWTTNGFVELIRNSDNSTSDFVRFGTNAVTPTTASGWSGASVAALPTGTLAYGKSIVRLASGRMADTNAAADWSQVNFATPGGPNDIAVGVIDSDGDGIPDSAKVVGGTYAGINLYAMGAVGNGKRDVFLEIQVMDQNPALANPDLGMIPQKAALQKVVDAFAAQNIRLHIDAGTRFSAAFSPVDFNLGGGNAPGTIPFSPCIFMSASTNLAGCTNLFTHKNSNFDVRRRVMFHYNMFASSQVVSGAAGSSGLAEIAGNDSMITMGNWGFSTSTTIATNFYINQQAGTLMHEFGHNLGLRHGGFEDTHRKPNYLSVMNYLYQLLGLPGSTNTTSSTDRYRMYVDRLSTSPVLYVCNLINSPCDTSFIIDYSNGSSAALTESALVEQALVGRGNVDLAKNYADWNLSLAMEVPAYSFDLNRDGLFTTMNDYNDWANIVLPFARTSSGFNIGASIASKASSTTQRSNPMRDHDKELIHEELPHAHHLHEIRQMALPGFRK